MDKQTWWDKLDPDNNFFHRIIIILIAFSPMIITMVIVTYLAFIGVLK